LTMWSVMFLPPILVACPKHCTARASFRKPLIFKLSV
jgi:hypothetical protein